MSKEEFIAAVLTNPVNRAILERMPELELRDAWLVSGALFQTVWNAITGRPPEYGIRDYDLFYFDSDTTWQAEDKIIRRALALFSDFDVKIEIRNQARVHLWYEEKFGKPYPPLSGTTQGIDRFLTVNAKVGIGPEGGSYRVYAPDGFDDIAKLIVRANRTPNFQAARYFEKAERWKSLWPGLAIFPA